ncbi:MAG: patatin-like phospholipase RssA, partial [Ectothiorhodospiraceae bacterium]|nr:patatin-like phospholipase RssA [Ectothiorhodospiraceae bacterium]
MAHRPVIGLALGSGSARGWAHIGVIRALEQQGIVPDVVSGTSIGALVGAALATGHLKVLEQWVRGLKWQDVVALMDFRLTGGGLIGGERLMGFLREGISEKRIEDCRKPFGAAATNLSTGNEVWLRHGPILDAVRASIALPGLFTPVQQEGRLLVDGGLVNPVPVSLCRAMGADVVIAVDLNTDIMTRHSMPKPGEAHGRQRKEAEDEGLVDRLSGLLDRLWPSDEAGEDALPSIVEVMARTVNIMSVRISRSRMAGDPPDVLITPRLARIGLLEF